MRTGSVNINKCAASKASEAVLDIMTKAGDAGSEVGVVTLRFIETRDTGKIVLVALARVVTRIESMQTVLEPQRMPLQD
jgi:hypothetical protein